MIPMFCDLVKNASLKPCIYFNIVFISIKYLWCCDYIYEI